MRVCGTGNYKESFTVGGSGSRPPQSPGIYLPILQVQTKGCWALEDTVYVGTLQIQTHTCTLYSSSGVTYIMYWCENQAQWCIIWLRADAESKLGHGGGMDAGGIRWDWSPVLCYIKYMLHNSFGPVNVKHKGKSAIEAVRWCSFLFSVFSIDTVSTYWMLYRENWTEALVKITVIFSFFSLSSTQTPDW